MPYPSTLRAGEQPALLILTLTNGHLMASHLYRSDARTLAMLNTWYARFIDALALVQRGNLDGIAGRGVVALHRDWGEPWHKHQPRFYRNLNALRQPDKRRLPTRLFLFDSPAASQWREDFLAL